MKAMKNTNDQQLWLPTTEVAPFDDAVIAKEIRAAGGYFQLGMFAEAESALDAIPVPPDWLPYLDGARCQVAYALGKMERVIEFGARHCTGAETHPLLFHLVAIALHQTGRWREAVEMMWLFSRHFLPCSSTRYGIACYLGRALEMERALMFLETAIEFDQSYQRKALIDTDLQPFWARLAQETLTPRMRRILTSHSFRRLASIPLRDTREFTWDIADRKALPAAFSKWMRVNPAKLRLEMAAATPIAIKRHFAEWTLSRARASQRLLRRAIQRAV
jgi:hypothetical protein